MNGNQKKRKDENRKQDTRNLRKKFGEDLNTFQSKKEKELPDELRLLTNVADCVIW
jgi:hypothetical protein